MLQDLLQPSHGARSLAAIQWSQISRSHPVEPDLLQASSGATSLAAIQWSQISTQPSNGARSFTAIQWSQISCSLPMELDLLQPSSGARSLAAIQWSQTSCSHPMEPDPCSHPMDPDLSQTSNWASSLAAIQWSQISAQPSNGARSLVAMQWSQIFCSHPTEPDQSQPRNGSISLCSHPMEPDLLQPSNWARSITAMQWIHISVLQLSHIMRKPVFGGLWPGLTQTSLLSHRYLLESWYFKDSIYRYYTIQGVNNKDADQTIRAVWSASWLIAYGIRQVFSWQGPIIHVHDCIVWVKNKGPGKNAHAPLTFPVRICNKFLFLMDWLKYNLHLLGENIQNVHSLTF